MATGSDPTTNVSGLVDEVVTQKYMKGVWENVTRVNQILERLEKNGNIDTDAEGEFISHRIRMGESQKSVRADLDERTFNREQHYATARFAHSWQEVTAALSERDIAYLSGTTTALVKEQKRKLRDMGKDFYSAISSDIVSINTDEDGNSVAGVSAEASSPVQLKGLLGMFGYGSTAYAWNPVSQSASTAATAVAASKEIRPDTDYGGLSTKPGDNISGVQNKTLEAYSPVIVNSKSTAFGTGTGTFKDSCLDALRHQIRRVTRGRDMSDRPDLALYTSDDYETIKAKIQSDVNQQVVLSDAPKSPDAGMYPRTFLPYEGVTVMFDLSMPQYVNYVLNTDYLWFSVFPDRRDNMLGKKGPFEGDVNKMFMVDMAKDIDQGAWKVVVQMAGQIYGNPHHQSMGYYNF